MITFCAKSGTGIDGIDDIDDIDGFGGSGTPGSTTPSDERDSTAQGTPGSSTGGSGTGGGLSAGAKGGITGGVVGAVLLLFIIMFVWLRRRRAAKRSALDAGSCDILGTDIAEKQGTGDPGNPGVRQLDMQSQRTGWEQLGGKEISTWPGSSARGSGSVAEMGLNTPRVLGTLPGEQSLGYSSVVTELESCPPATTELDSAGASNTSPRPVMLPAGGTRVIPDSEGLIPMPRATGPAEARSYRAGFSAVASQAQESSRRPLSGGGLGPAVEAG